MLVGLIGAAGDRCCDLALLLRRELDIGPVPSIHVHRDDEVLQLELVNVNGLYRELPVKSAIRHALHICWGAVGFRWLDTTPIELPTRNSVRRCCTRV